MKSDWIDMDVTLRRAILNRALQTLQREDKHQTNKRALDAFAEYAGNRQRPSRQRQYRTDRERKVSDHQCPFHALTKRPDTLLLFHAF